MRALQRTSVVCLTAVLAVWFFYMGREHQIFLENRTVEANGRSFRALELVRVTVDGARPIEMMPRERDLVRVIGPSFRLKVEVLDAFGDETEKLIEMDIKLGFTRDIMISMPLLAAHRKDYILPPPALLAPPSEPDPVSDEMDKTEIDF